MHRPAFTAIDSRPGRTQPAAAALWLVAAALLLPVLPAQAQSPTNVYDYSRKSAFEYDDAGWLVVERVEPDRADLCVKTTHTRDGWGNTVGVLTQPCAGASATAVFVQRGSTSVHAAQEVVLATGAGTGVGAVTVGVPAGAYATRVSNALGHAEDRTHDPRFGTVLSLTGPNGLTTRWSVDDFGRIVRETRADGTALATEHCLIAGRGLDTASNTAGCGSTAALSGLAEEIPALAVSYVQTTPLDAKGVVMGPRSRVYADRAGRTLRELTEVALDHDAQPASRRWTVRDTGYSATGVVQWRTQPYFLGAGSSTTTGSQDHGLDVTTVDALGRVVRIDTADPAGSVQATQHGYTRRWARTSIEYSGLSTTTTGPQGHTRREEKNAEGRVVRITDASGAQLAHQHDAFGLLVQTQDALQNLVRMAYDIRGRKTRVEDPDTGLWTYEYNALGERVRQQSPKQRAATQASQQATTIAYDALGRMTQRVLPEYTSTWYHDRDAQGQACGKSVGQLCQVVTSHGITRRLSYDSLGRPSASRTDISGGPSLASAQAYDSTTGRLSSQTWPTGLQLSYQYTARGGLASVQLANAATLKPLPPRLGAPAPASIALPARTELWRAGSVNAWGQLQSQTHASLTSTGAAGPGTAIRSTYDAATGRVTALGAGPGNTTTHSSVDLAYAWDSLGQLTGRTDALGDGLTGAVTETYQYDALQRLSGYTVAAPEIPQLQRTVTLSYNAIGNLLHKSDVGNYSYPAYGNSTGTSAGTSRPRPHAVSQISGSTWGTVSYSYDANGNLTGSSSANGQTGAGGRARSITYTSFNLPDSQGGIAGPGNLPRSTWHYDERQQRIRHTLATVQGTRTTWYLHPDNQGGLGFETETHDIPATPNATPAPAATQHRHYLTAGGQTLVLITSGALPTLTSTQLAPVAATSVTVVQWQAWIRDPQGTVVATLDPHGAVTARLAYDPFGQRRHASGQYDAFGTLVVQWAATHAAGPERGYTGHEHLDDFGLIHMNGRLYEPATGRFLQPDPFIQDPTHLQNFNRYSYCFNSPTNCTDPTGYFSWVKLRDRLIRAGAMVLDAMGCSGFCSAAVYAYQGYRAGGHFSAVMAAFTSYAGYQVGAAGDPATMGFFAAASGCVNAVASGGDCSGGLKAGVETWVLGEVHAVASGFQVQPNCLVACVVPDNEEHYAPDVRLVAVRLESNAPLIHTFVINGRLERTWWSSYRDAVASSLRSDPWFEVQRLIQGVPATAAPAGFLWVSRAGNVSRQAAKVPIWSSTKKLSPVENALGHWNKHKAEFPELANAKQYVEAARSFAASPPAGTLTRSRGADTLIYHPASNTFLVTGADGAPRTMFRPDPAKHGYPTNLDFFHAK